MKLEIILLLLALCYSLYYIFDRFFSNYERIKNILLGGKRARAKRSMDDKKQPTKAEKEKRIYSRHTKEKAYNANAIQHSSHLSPEDKSKLEDIIKRVHLNKMRGYSDKARTLIVEGLAIDKNNAKLNLELADMYEEEKEYQKAEYIYREMLEKSEDNFEMLTSLGASLEMQEKNEQAITIYTKAHNKKKTDINILEKLSEITFDLTDYSASLFYTILYLKQVPRNAEKIAMLGYCLEKDNQLEKAIQEYERALQIQPYNTEIQTRITKLQTKIKR